LTANSIIHNDAVRRRTFIPHLSINQIILTKTLGISDVTFGGNIMKRLHWSILSVVVLLAFGLTTYLVRAGGSHTGHTAAGPVAAIDGPLSNATVSFGGWMTSPPLDRFPNESPRTANHHELIPEFAKIKAGGTVNFIIGGFHHVLVYDDGTQPGDINTTITVPPTNQPQPLLIADPNRRIYRGLDPSTQVQDRVEVVQFPNPGTYLVICGVLPHFQEGMYGFVKVVR
jgi:plastocyanin